MGLIIREIETGDNKMLAGIIRNALLDFNAAKPGTVYFDNTTDHLYEVFRKKNSAYFVVHNDGELLGGSGIYPTEGLPDGVCELVKLYLSASSRGQGTGKLLMNRCLTAAKEMGYSKVYLETMPELNIAVPMYEKAGFKMLEGPLGNSGHTGCGIWMLLDL
jgi:putative acetyltransferase